MNKTFQNNIDALKILNPGMAKQIEEAERIPEIESISPNILVKYRGGTLPIHQIHDPDSHSKKIVNQYPLLQNDLTVIVGCGDRYLVHQILKKKKKLHLVLIVEPIPFFIKILFENYNLKKLILDGTLYFVTDIEGIGGTVGILESLFVIENWQTVIEEYIGMLPDYYHNVIDMVVSSLNQVRCNTGTAMSSGLQMAMNDISNLPYIMRYRGVVDLKDVFKGKPAVCVSTGPSLRKNLWRLKGMEGKVVIIAVAQALRTLMAYGITPDFITTVDFGETNYGHFRGIMDSDIPLVCLNRTYYKVLKEYKGMKIVVANQAIPGDESSTGMIGRKGTLEQGGSVSHFSMGFALFMGCNPITMIGQDLSYDIGNRSHSNTVDESGEVSVDKNGMIMWDVKDPRSKLFTGEKYTMGPAQYVPGYLGGIVLTNVGLMSFITAYEQIVKYYPKAKICNSTEGGANIEGTERISLKEFLTTYCTKKINKSVIKPLLTLDPNGNQMMEEAITKLETEIKDLDEIMRSCKEGIRTNDLTSKLNPKKDKDKIIGLLKINMENSNKANEMAKKNFLVSIGIYNESRMIAGRDLKVKGPTATDLGKEENLKIRLKRNKIILESAIKTTESLLPEYRKALEIFKRYRENKDDSIFKDDSNYIPNLDDVEKLMESGNWATPMIDARRILLNASNSNKDRIEATKILQKSDMMKKKEIDEAKNLPDNTNLIRYLEIIDKVKKEGFGKKQIDDSLLPKMIKELKAAKKLQPDKMEARWGLATCYSHSGQFEKSLKEYEYLVKKFPTILRLKFEQGMVMLNTNPSEGRKKISEVMEKTTDYDYFLSKMGTLAMMEEIWDEARDYYLHYLDKFPNDSEAIKSLVKCYENLGDETHTRKYKNLLCDIEGSK